MTEVQIVYQFAKNTYLLRKRWKQTLDRRIAGDTYILLCPGVSKRDVLSFISCRDQPRR